MASEGNHEAFHLIFQKQDILFQMKSDEYWSLLANEMDLFSRKRERIANDL